MKKALIITYYWPPSGGAGVQRWLKFVKYLPKTGIECFILTVNPDQASYPVQDETLLNEIPPEAKIYYTPTFEPFDLYRKISGNKDIPFAGFANEGIPGLKEKISRFIRGNFFIPDARKGWNKYAIEKASEIIEKENIDCIITTSPPHSSQLIGLALQHKYKLPWIADIRDPWTDIYYYSKMYPIASTRKKDLSLEQTVLEKADKVIVVSESIKRLFSTKSKLIDKHKIEVIPNGFDQSDFENGPYKQEDKFLITYTGTLTDSYNIKSFIQAIKEVKQMAGTDVLLRFVGSLSENIYQEFIKEGLKDQVEIIPHVGHSKAIEYMRSSTALLLVIPDVENNEGILTGKLFEYLASQKPIICIGPENGDAAEIIRECEAGKVFDYDSYTHIKSHISMLAKKWNNQGNLSCEGEQYTKYSRQALTKKLSMVLLAGPKI